jgi:hypothetical protein
MSSTNDSCSRSLRAALAISAVSLLVIGCGNHSDVPVTPIPDGGYVYDAGTANFPPPVADAGPPTPAPTAAPCDPVQGAAMTSMLVARQKAEAPGMTVEGSPLCGVLPQGMSVSSSTIALQPGRCYTVLAQGQPNVTQVDVELDADLSIAGPFAALFAGKSAVVASGTSAGITAAVGAKNECYAWPWPFPGQVKVTVKSTMGAGPVAAQLYSKKK